MKHDNEKAISEQTQADEGEDIKRYTLESSWKNAYWFARMLINNDKYGAVGGDSATLCQISYQLHIILEQDDPDDVKIKLCNYAIKNILMKRYQRARTRHDRIKLLCHDLSKRFKTLDDIRVFILTLESIIIPINNALPTIPSSDKEFAEEIARAYLDTLGTKGLATVINIWDDVGVEGCLNAERVAVVREFTRLRRDISNMPEIEANLVLTAFTQEFERRLSQKRKSRAGGSLEDVASFLFDYYGIQAAHAPEHFQADIEVDKWVKCKDGWLIGISCKRTLRERWKQVSSADRGILSRYKIKQIWHLLTYDEDLSDDKITTLGNLGHIFYLSDDSRKLHRASNHIGMKGYVRPMSRFIDDLKAEQSK
ncbi:MAG: hypothetical protein ACOX1Y_05225 [Zhaonellaceae bacterium]|jgi:hypothetical protein|nr:hypothetical protein [Clostridia bacterium]